MPKCRTQPQFKATLFVQTVWDSFVSLLFWRLWRWVWSLADLKALRFILCREEAKISFVWQAWRGEEAYVLTRHHHAFNTFHFLGGDKLDFNSFLVGILEINWKSVSFQIFRGIFLWSRECTYSFDYSLNRSGGRSSFQTQVIRFRKKASEAEYNPHFKVKLILKTSNPGLSSIYYMCWWVWTRTIFTRT